MTDNRLTKRAFLASLLSMLLCVSMLIGTTFAWFTDTASTGVNQISSGNLDVAFEYSYDMITWNDAEGASEIFDPNAKWEPGFSEVVYLKVINKGTLAFNYRLGTNLVGKTLGKTVGGQDIDLAEFIKFGIAENVTAAYADRASAIAAVAASAMDFGALYLGEMTLENKNDEAVFAMVVYMPETVGNDANHNGVNVPSISFGLEIVATQLAYENDSFGSDYDEGSTYPGSAFATYVPGAETVINGNNFDVSIPATAALETEDGVAVATNTDLVMSIETTSVNPNITVNVGEGAETYEIRLVTADGNKVNATGAPIVVEMNIGAGRTGDISLYHNETPIASNYDAATGILRFETASFSPFTVVETFYTVDISWYNDSDSTFTLSNAGQLVGFAGLVNDKSGNFAGKTILLSNDIDLNGTPWTPIYAWGGVLDNTVIDGQGNSIIGLKVEASNQAGFISANASKLSIKNLTFENANIKTTASSQAYAGVLIGKNYSNLIIENVDVKNSSVVNNWQCGGLIGFGEECSVTFKDCDLNNVFVGGYNATAGALLGLGTVTVATESCTASNVRLYTDGMTWDSTQKEGGDALLVGHLYGETFTADGCTVDCTVVSVYDN